MEFNSQICTTEEQSKRLLALGLKKETADCQYAALVVDWKGNPISNPKWRFYDHNKGFIVQNFERMERYPAWSLHRLLCLLPTEYIADIDFQHIMQDFVFRSQDMYDEVISCIETLIKEGYFYEEYLSK
jgi:hypothetical protein